MRKPATVTPARQAREDAGLTLEQVSKRVRRTARYIGQCERAQDFSLVLAEHLARVYNCTLHDFRPVGRPAAGRTKKRTKRTTGGGQQ